MGSVVFLMSTPVSMSMTPLGRSVAQSDLKQAFVICRSTQEAMLRVNHLWLPLHTVII